MTEPKLRLETLEFRISVPLTTSMAELLVAVPALLVTTTANCELLSAVVVAGVV